MLGLWLRPFLPTPTLRHFLIYLLNLAPNRRSIRSVPNIVNCRNTDSLGMGTPLVQYTSILRTKDLEYFYCFSSTAFHGTGRNATYHRPGPTLPDTVNDIM